MVLGRRQLQRWVQLLLYAQGGSDISSPLLTLAAVRAKFMENLCRAIPNQGKANDELRERAFMAGILSLVDTVLGMKMEEVLKQFSLVDEVRDAVLERKGLLGEMLTLIEKVEAGSFETVAENLATLGLSVDDLNKAQLEAIQWAANLGEEAE